jgi:hypothetical protein
MQFRMSIFALVAGVIVLAASAALAGQLAEFEEQLWATDAPYRSALFSDQQERQGRERAGAEEVVFGLDGCASMSATFFARPFRGWFRGDQSR